VIAAEELRYRPVTAIDGPSLYRLFLQVNAAALATLAGDTNARQALASMEYVEESVRTKTEFPDAVDLAIEHRGTVCGRMTSVMREGGIQLLRLSVLAEHRGQGIGTQAMHRLARLAEDHGCLLWLRADAASQGCRGFLEHVGFEVVGRGGRIHLEHAGAVAAA
jgi:GNAT superfamily N-acetyltransferase